ncbi:MarR family winged helix-turn-helix transcriptional regulator [Luteipulveratus flavus]|uniref:MarR family winged helix-turn-helix transcriptional regulator n=1 Tax=Luteipulveratus flavus TaxID=3031728 RepID=A0ABT6C1T0_9MICO|nr:MarR family winged helix-turn-helix transcriptional regulator [Luteipulveratus sp. YIM 133296]MDF8262732.1 MarR family winged helix-turn-helix transcriptional regulator [Luteipulveratus sp. YIM 133296]
MAAAREDLLASVHPLAKALRRIEDAAAATQGLTMWRYAILRGADAVPGSTQNDLAARLGYSRNRIVADLDALEESALVVRRRAADRRANAIEITVAGRRVMRAVQREIHRREDELLADLSPTTRRDLARAVERAAQAVRA